MLLLRFLEPDADAGSNTGTGADGPDPTINCNIEPEGHNSEPDADGAVGALRRRAIPLSPPKTSRGAAGALRRRATPSPPSEPSRRAPYDDERPRRRRQSQDIDFQQSMSKVYFWVPSVPEIFRILNLFSATQLHCALKKLASRGRLRGRM